MIIIVSTIITTMTTTTTTTIVIRLLITLTLDKSNKAITLHTIPLGINI